jgi:bifunctional non-homologous end joining protein LigD
MLAARRSEPFVDSGWVFELKWDGVRALLNWDGTGVRLLSRSGNDISAKYPELHGFRADRPLVIDGEIVALDAAGRPSFERLQGRMNLSGLRDIAAATRAVPISYVGFDILFDDGDITREPWEVRRARLESLELAPPFVLSTVVASDPSALWALVNERGFEGIMAKRLGSRYRPGARSAEWLKITRFRRLRAMVGGYLPGDGVRSGGFGSLLLGLWDGDRLRWIGAVGSGFGEAALRAISETLHALRTADSPFHPDPAMPSNAVWVEPRLVAVVQFKEFTGAGRLRGPSFKGFSDDDPTTVTWDTEGPAGPG